MAEIIYQGLLKYNDLFGHAGWSLTVAVIYHPSKLIRITPQPGQVLLDGILRNK